MGKTMCARHLTIPQEYMEIVGGITAYWATFEHELVDLLGETMRIGKKERRILMAKMDPKAKLAMLKVIASKFIKNPKTRGKVNALAAAGNSLYDVPNWFVHGAWVHPIDTPNIHQLLLIDSGEAAYLPKRIDVPIESGRRIVANFAQLVRAARTITNQIATQCTTTEIDDGLGSVTGEAEPPTPLVIPDDVADGEN